MKYHIYISNSNTLTIIALIAIGIAPIILAVTMFVGTERFTPTGEINVYNNQTKSFRKVQINGFVPINGDVADTPIYKTEIEKRYWAGLYYLAIGLFITVSGIKTLHANICKST